MTLVPIEALTTLTKFEQEVALTMMLDEAHAWLTQAVEATDPVHASDFKAWASTVMEAARQKKLSLGVQQKAEVIVRRAERNVGLAIRKGQAEGTITTRSDNAATAAVVPGAGSRGVDADQFPGKAKPTDFASKSELFGSGRTPGFYAMAEASDEHFEEALEEAVLEGKVNRGNVATKARQKQNVVTRDMRAQWIRDMAEQGYASRQMVARVGVTEETVRLIAREFDIEIPADKVLKGSRRLDHTQMVENHVTALGNSVAALQYIDFAEVDFKEADEWVSSLTTSIAALNRFKKQIKENTHV